MSHEKLTGLISYVIVMSRETAFFLQTDSQFRISLKRVVITDDLVEGNSRNNDFSDMNNCRQLNVCASPVISNSSSANQLNNGCFQTKLSSPALSSSSANHTQKNYQQNYSHQQIKSSSFTGQLKNKIMCKNLEKSY